MNKIGFIFAIVVASASCYDFLNGDPFFELPINRFKRAAKESPHCCGNDFVGKPVTFLGRLSRECLLDFEPNAKDAKALANMTYCAGDCVAKNEGTVRDGKIDRKKVLEYLRRHDKDEYRIQMYEENLEKCISEAKEIQERLAGKTKCDSTAVSLMQCLNRELLENCPEDKQNLGQEKVCGKVHENSRFSLEQVFQE